MNNRTLYVNVAYVVNIIPYRTEKTTYYNARYMWSHLSCVVAGYRYLLYEITLQNQCSIIAYVEVHIIWRCFTPENTPFL